MAPAGTVEYLAGYAWDVSDCAACGCRFTRHDQDVYKLLHESGGLWFFKAYRGLAGECRRLFEQRNRGGLRRVLSETPKYGSSSTGLQAIAWGTCSRWAARAAISRRTRPRGAPHPWRGRRL